MTTVGQFNSKNPTIKRILKEASELSANPSPDYTASPLDSNLFEWHFTIRGPPSSPYAHGIYHGRIVLPPAYPHRPPSFRFLTPSGRFEQNREICLSISGHHEESWQPAWGIRTALVAIRSFMDSDAKGQVGGVNAGREVRLSLARESRAWRCAGCKRSNEEILSEVQAEEGKVDDVPSELRLGYRDEMEAAAAAAAAKSDAGNTGDFQGGTLVSTPTRTTPVDVGAGRTNEGSSTTTRPMVAAPATRTRRRSSGTPAWVDVAIGGVTAALIVMVLKKLLAVY